MYPLMKKRGEGRVINYMTSKSVFIRKEMVCYNFFVVENLAVHSGTVSGLL
jgi:hypothetical protein